MIEVGSKVWVRPQGQLKSLVGPGPFEAVVVGVLADTYAVVSGNSTLNQYNVFDDEVELR